MEKHKPLATTPATVLVTSASGRTGNLIVAALARRGVRVHGLIRRDEQREKLACAGAELIIGDLADRTSLDRACEGAQTVIHIGPPMHSDEVAYTKNIIAAARTAGVNQFVFYSVMHPQLADLYHHAQKLRSEEQVLDAGFASHVILQPARYMQHLELVWPDVTQKGIYRTPFRTTVLLSVVDVLDLADAAAIVATEPGHCNATYQLAGPEALTQDEMAAILADELGREVRAEGQTPEEQSEVFRRRGIDGERIARIEVMNRHYDLHGFVGNPNVLRMILRREPMKFRNYVRRLVGKKS